MRKSRAKIIKKNVAKEMVAHNVHPMFVDFFYRKTKKAYSTQKSGGK